MCASQKTLELAKLWTPVALWGGLIFGLSSVPDLSTGLGRWDLLARKLGHAAEFAVLAGLFGRAWAGSGCPSPETLQWGTLAFCVFYAVTDEWHQSFVPGRVASGGDVMIDLAGAWGAALLRRRGADLFARSVSRTDAT